MYINLALKWTTDSPDKRTIEPELFILLGEIAKTHSLKKAAQATAISYRHAWGLIKKWESYFNTPLVDLKRGRGQRTRLTKFGDAFYSEHEISENKLINEFKKIKHGLNKKLETYLDSSIATSLSISASNDLVISILKDILINKFKQKCELNTRGSIENLRLLTEGHCNVAGFHFPLEKVNHTLKTQYTRWLDQIGHELILLSVRRQGIMVSRANTKKIQGLSDLTKRSVKYINRQKRSGTRIIFDELIKQANIQPKQINGYYNEEFTHIAVAAMIASGAADAGMGLEAVAKKFKLHFIPQIKEAYFLAFNKKDKMIKQACVKAINTEAFKEKLKNLPGYDFRNMGSEIPVNSLLGNEFDML